MAHTSGPWFASRVLEDEFGFDFVTVGPFDTLDRADSNHHEDTIADVSGVNHDASANAQLIAAAPDLLAALRGIREIGKRCLVNPKYDGYFETADAAIAKAEGR